MPEFSNLLGYDVKDATARASITALETKTASDIETLQTNMSNAINVVQKNHDADMTELQESVSGQFETMNTNIANDFSEMETKLQGSIDDLQEQHEKDMQDIVNNQNNVINQMNKVSNLRSEYYNYMFAPYCEEVDYYPQGTCFIDDSTAVVAYAKPADNTVILHKLNMETGAILASSKIVGYHANSMTFDGDSTIYSVQFYSTGTTGTSNVLQLIDVATLQIKGTMQIVALVDIGVRSATYKDGYLYIMDRNNGFWKHDIANETTEKLFDFTQVTYQVAFIDSDDNVWLLPGSGSNIYVYNLSGEMIHTVSMGEHSADCAIINLEYESINQLSDGTIILSDVGWKYTADGRYNRHIFFTLGVNKAKHEANPIFRFDSSSAQVYFTNTYNPIQNGSAAYPFDSIDYGCKIAALYRMECVINLKGETFNQYAILSELTGTILNGSFGGLVLDRNANIRLSCKITGSCATEIQTRRNLDAPICVLQIKYSILRMWDGEINGQGLTDCVGLWTSYGCEYTIAYNLIKNCAVPIRQNGGGELFAYGLNVPYSNGAASVPPYRYKQNDNIKYQLVGNMYGMQTVTANQTLDSEFTVQFNAANFETPMLSAEIGGKTFVFDIHLNRNVSFAVNVSDTWYLITGTINYGVVDTYATITFTGFSGVTLDGTTADLSAITVGKVRVF